MVRILRLRAYCYPENVAASAIGEDLDEAFAKNGIVTVNYTPMPSRGVSNEVRAAYKKRKYEEQRDGHVIIHRFPMIREGTNVLQKALKYLLCTLVEYFKGIKAEDIDAIMCSSTPPTQGVLCALVAKKLSKRYGRIVPFIYNLQDIFPDSLVNTGLINQGSLLWKIGRKIEDYTYRHADKIIVISEDFKQNIMAKGVTEDKIVVIPNWADTKGVHPVDRKDNVLFDRYNLDRSKFYVCYSGNIGYTQDMDLLLDAAQIIKSKLPDVRFVIIGEGAAKAEVARRIKDEGIDNVTVLPFQPYKDIASVFSLGDVGLIISKPGIGTNSVPSKTWNIMAAERPILASFDSDSSLASLINRLDCGVVAEAGIKEQLVNAFCQLTSDAHLQEMGRRGKDYLVTELDKDKCVNKYVETLKLCIFKNQ